MVDIHCHLLPGLDDGPEGLDESLEMAEVAIADGITHVVATPHSNQEFAFDPELIRRRREELQEKVGDRLKIATGCDFHLSYENLEKLHAEPGKFTINGKNYLLVEFADFAIPPGIDDILHRLHLAGLSTIVTHPERNVLICAKPEQLHRWIHQGSYVQVTAQSLLGRFGKRAQQIVERLLDEGRIHFFASDAHDPKNRPPKLHEAFDLIAKRYGDDAARALFHDNPLAAFEGRPLPYVPETPEAGEGGRNMKVPSRRKRFIFF